LLLKVFHFGNKKFMSSWRIWFMCGLVCWPQVWFMWGGKKRDWTGHHSRLRVFKRGKNWFFISWRIFPFQTKCEAPICDQFTI
jgi:hypothetical protein